MKFLIKKKYIILFLLAIFVNQPEVIARDNKALYKKENISNYFSGIVSSKNYYNKEAYKHLKKVKLLKNEHSKFNVEFIRTLVLLDKFEKAVSYSKKSWNKDQSLFDLDLLLGLDYFLKQDYKNAEKHFLRLNEISKYNIYFYDFIGNVLIAWSKAEQNKKDESFKFIQKVPKSYQNLKKAQNIFLKCHFNTKDTVKSFKEIIKNEDNDFSRFDFFLINHLVHKNQIEEAKKIIKSSRKKYKSNLLLKETENSLLNKNSKKIKNSFDCAKSTDSIAEFFYVLGNLYAGEQNYQLSNFYLKLSLMLNNKFLTNNALLAENYFYQKKYEKSKKFYESLKPIGPTYSWFASKSIAQILSTEKGKKYAVESLENEFNSLPNISFEHYYDIANFYKTNEYYNESIKYYSLALKEIKKNHYLFPKILDRRGASYERIGDWKSAEADLLESLEVLPDQAGVLNYLGYSWIDKGINLDKGLEMIKKANMIKKGDGYIIDSLGWAYYLKKDYTQAKKFLEQAVELRPSDPVINDHYADSLWKLNKNIQARYVWNYVLTLEGTEQKLKDTINKKLIFGISKKL